MFESCKSCVPPKRKPGCHDKCPDYIKDKKEHDEFKKKIWEKKKIEKELSEYKKEAVNKERTKKFRRNKK